MKQIFSNNQYKIINVVLNQGEAMPLHKATQDAFIIVQEGKAKIIFEDNEVSLLNGTFQLIPGNKPHQLKIEENFKACVVLPVDAEIKFL